jgi:CheY-like chemotaxis protein
VGRVLQLRTARESGGNDVKTILVVDDEFANVEALRLILTSQGYQVLRAWNGKDGLALVKDNQVDLIISDVLMPIMDGLEMCRIIQQNALQPVPHIILMSATSLPALEDGFHYDHFLTKPFSLAQLNEAVRSSIGSPDDA